MRSVIIAAGCVLAIAAAAGCSSGDPKNPGTVTVTVPPSPAAQPSSSSGAASVSSSASATASAAPTTLAGTCASLLADYTVSNALGGLDLGRTAFVVGVPDKTIGRLSTINCRYLVTGTGAKEKAGIEIGVSLYSTPEQAAKRITATTDDYVGHGASSTDTPVPTTPAVTASLLSGGRGDGYDLPLLVAAVDRRTIAVTVDPSAVTKPAAAQAAVTLVKVAAERTAA